MASAQSGSRGRSYPVRPPVSRAGACGGLDTPPALPLYGEAARLAELVDAAGLGPAAARCGGSSPSPGTKHPSKVEQFVQRAPRDVAAQVKGRFVVVEFLALERLDDQRRDRFNPLDPTRIEPEVVAGHPDRILSKDAAATLKSRMLTNLRRAPHPARQRPRRARLRNGRRIWLAGGHRNR